MQRFLWTSQAPTSRGLSIRKNQMELVSLIRSPIRSSSWSNPESFFPTTSCRVSRFESLGHAAEMSFVDIRSRLEPINSALHVDSTTVFGNARWFRSVCLKCAAQSWENMITRRMNTRGKKPKKTLIVAPFLAGIKATFRHPHLTANLKPSLNPERHLCSLPFHDTPLMQDDSVSAC